LLSSATSNRADPRSGSGTAQLLQARADAFVLAREGIELGVCGEHGGDPDSITFFHRVGLDYVSCSPYRVPIARLAAAQAALGKTVASQA